MSDWRRGEVDLGCHELSRSEMPIGAVRLRARATVLDSVCFDLGLLVLGRVAIVVSLFVLFILFILGFDELELTID